MPNIKAAEKWVRQSTKRTTRNLDVKSRLKTLYKKADNAEQAAAVESQLDKAAAKGIIHPNKAARKKSRLAKALTAPSAPAKASKTAKAAKTSKAAAKTATKKSSAKKTAKSA